jgi:hypothetical protein
MVHDFVVFELLGLGPSLQWHLGADIAGADPAQVMAMAPTARLDHVRAVGDRTSRRWAAALRGNVGLGVPVASDPLVVHLAESTRVVTSSARVD